MQLFTHKPGTALRLLMMVLLIAVQGMAVAHDVTHADLGDMENCAVCVIGGNAEGTVDQPHFVDPTGLPEHHSNWAIAPFVSRRCTNNHPARAPPSTL